MARGAGGGRPESGIYGTVLTAGLLAAQDPRHDPMAGIVLDVLVTVTVFWLAHGYAHAVGHPLARGEPSGALDRPGDADPGPDPPGSAAGVSRRPAPDRAPADPSSGPRVRGLRLAWTALVANWPLARASILPLGVLVLARLAGASVDDAQEAALWTCVALLALWGLRAGRAAGLGGWRLVRYATGSSLLGLVLVALEVLIH